VLLGRRADGKSGLAQEGHRGDEIAGHGYRKGRVEGIAAGTVTGKDECVLVPLFAVKKIDNRAALGRFILRTASHGKKRVGQRELIAGDIDSGSALIADAAFILILKLPLLIGFSSIELCIAPFEVERLARAAGTSDDHIGPTQCHAMAAAWVLPNGRKWLNALGQLPLIVLIAKHKYDAAAGAASVDDCSRRPNGHPFPVNGHAKTEFRPVDGCLGREAGIVAGDNIEQLEGTLGDAAGCSQEAKNKPQHTNEMGALPRARGSRVRTGFWLFPRHLSRSKKR